MKKNNNSYLKHGRGFFFYAGHLTNVVKVEGEGAHTKRIEQPTTQTRKGKGNEVLCHAYLS